MKSNCLTNLLFHIFLLEATLALSEALDLKVIAHFGAYVHNSLPDWQTFLRMLNKLVVDEVFVRTKVYTEKNVFDKVLLHF